MKLRSLFESHASELPKVDERELALLERHHQLLVEWNENIGLVSRKSIDSAFAIHYADSLHICELASPFAEGFKVADFGSGAGFPGIVFAIRYPQTPITLYEKLLKKQSFLSVVVQTLGLTNVTVQGAMPAIPGKVLLLGRAVLPPPELFKFARRQLDSGSRFVMNRGGSAPDEPSPKGFLPLANVVYTLPLEQGPRRTVVYELVPRGTK